ncbi:MAG TPA: efflux transporter periplasmic adaptor subunit, partial [Candidatus Limnocylindria bacterium]|nr:efflux transporter periplasmic adaptor subunit [Candidatus Limnocylindria bacterium]
ALDEATRSVLVEADLPNPDLTLRPGMYATVKVGVEKHTGVLLVPNTSLLTEKSGASVFVVAGGKARKTPVKTGFKDGAQVELVGGMEGGEAVILFGKQPPIDGQSVNVVEAR